VLLFTCVVLLFECEVRVGALRGLHLWFKRPKGLYIVLCIIPFEVLGMGEEEERFVEVKLRCRMALVVWEARLGERIDCVVDERSFELEPFKIRIPESWVEIMRLIQRSYIKVDVSGGCYLDRAGVVE